MSGHPDDPAPWSASHALAPLPPSYIDTRNALHRLAMHVVYRPRREATGRFGLCWTPGGFGTPVYGDDERVRVQGVELVHECAGDRRVAPLSCVRAAAEHVGIEFDPAFDHGMHDVVDPGDPDEDLPVDEASVLALGDWFGLATAVLDDVRAAHPDASPTTAQLWPEHFDLAIDLAYGPGEGQRVNVGFSPGDPGPADSPTATPYLYVGPWTADRPGDPGYWNASFGATLGYDEIRSAGAGDAQRDRALAFIADGLALLGKSQGIDVGSRR